MKTDVPLDWKCVKVHQALNGWSDWNVLSLMSISGFFFFNQDLKPSNLAVNEDCELKVRIPLLFFYPTDVCILQSTPHSLKLLFRFWTLVWRGTPTTRWPATWPRAGIVRLRSCWTGCITTWQVNGDGALVGIIRCLSAHHDWKIVGLLFSVVMLLFVCSSGHLVSGVYNGRTAHWKNFVSWYWSYPFHLSALSYWDSGKTFTQQVKHSLIFLFCWFLMLGVFF